MSHTSFLHKGHNPQRRCLLGTPSCIIITFSCLVGHCFFFVIFHREPTFAKIDAPPTSSSEQAKKVVKAPPDAREDKVAVAEEPVEVNRPRMTAPKQGTTEKKSGESDQPVKPCAIARFPFPAENDWELRLRKVRAGFQHNVFSNISKCSAHC